LTGRSPHPSAQSGTSPLRDPAFHGRAVATSVIDYDYDSDNDLDSDFDTD
jgi:hypothetical protein